MPSDGDARGYRRSACPVFTRASATSGVEGDTTRANQRRFLYGPTIGIANNGNGGFRVSATGYFLRRRRGTGVAESDRVKGISAELALDLYFARVELRSMQFDVPLLMRFTACTSLRA